MIILSILLSISSFIIGLIMGMGIMIDRLQKRGMLKENDNGKRQSNK